MTNNTTHKIDRCCFFQSNGQTINLTDIPHLSVSELKEFYSNKYPQLLNATIQNKGFVNMKSTYEFVTIAGTKA